MASRYQLLDRIGSGSMGVVWKARDTVLDRIVAVKQLLPPPELDGPAIEQAAARARREARTAARLRHPHAVMMFDVVWDDGLPCLVMEYVPARSLAEMLQQEGSLPPAEVARIGVQVASALAAAHKVGIVHRDVKPGNVLLEPDGTAKLADFGISHAIGEASLTATGLIQGTPAYLAPEVAQGEPATPASDVFSLGATLYRAVEGVPPFGTDDNQLSLLRAVADGRIRAPQRAGPLTVVLEALLRRHPGDRMSLADALPALAAAASSAPTPAAGFPLSPDARTTAIPAQSRGERKKRVPLVLPTKTLMFGAVLLALTVAALMTGVMMPGKSGSTPPAAAGTSTASRAPSSPVPTAPTSVGTQDVRTFIVGYYSLLPRRLDDAQRLLTPKYLASVGGSPAFRGFYQTIRSVQVRAVTVTGSGTATATLLFTRNDGTTSVETYQFTLVPSNGTFLIDAANKN